MRLHDTLPKSIKGHRRLYAISSGCGAPFDDKKFIVELPSNKAEVSSTPLAFSKSTSIEVSCHREVHIPLACEEACELRSILSISCACM